jgi:hypothetical protein
MFVIVFNQNSIVPDGQNNKLVYKFPNSTVLTNKYIAISSISMFYSWFNITALSNNNIFTYTWTSGDVATTYTITIPDGLYEIVALNNLIQFNCINNGTYWISALGTNVYPFEIIVNQQRYAIQLNTYLIPTTLPTGAILPPIWAGLPTVSFNSQVSFPAFFNQIVGYSAGFISDNNVDNAFIPPSPTIYSNYCTKNSINVPGGGTLSYLSNLPPEVQPNNNVLVSISNINNPYAQPSSIIYSLNPKVKGGEQIYDVPPNFMWNRLIDGTYNDIRLTLLGTDLKPLVINDPNMTILLTIRDANEMVST